MEKPPLCDATVTKYITDFTNVDSKFLWRVTISILLQLGLKVAQG